MIIAYKMDLIKKAKIILSIVVVFVFLPVMFFTNGGVLGGTPVWLLLGTIYIALILDGALKIVMLVFNGIVITACWIVGYLYPGGVEEYSRGGNYFDTWAALFIVGGVVYTLFSFQNALVKKDEERKNVHRLFEQTAVALVNAIDAKDKYTHGHSSRVAEYSKRIAEHSGMSPEECNEIYYVALLHDVGKIGIPEHIINKEGKLSDEEYEVIKQHPVLGAQILHSITEYPRLSLGAFYHHERYDGKGYPTGLKGKDIPAIARIISVADAYDAMTSKRSYREAIPQQTVREEIVKGMGTQFDPEYAKIMQHLIDLDSEYMMKEMDEIKELAGKNGLVCDRFRDEVSEGILMNRNIKHISFRCSPIGKGPNTGLPAIILFDSLDGRIHDTEREIKDLCYFEYAEIWFYGRTMCKGARKIKSEEGRSPRAGYSAKAAKGYTEYDIEAVKCKDHIQIKIDDGIKLTTLIVALPDSSRYAYIGLAGEKCNIYDVSISQDEDEITEGYIPRIAEEISYINVPAGDVPNVQIDGYRTDSTEGIPVTDGMKIVFHSKSLPTARLVWHCAFLDVFYSEDKKPNGPGYMEYALLRLDGENWEAQGTAENRLIINKGEEFTDWEDWKKMNKEGFECTISFKREGDTITTYTENMGISIKITTKILKQAEDVYVALSGDQVALTNIRIIR
ncbi:MAG: HD-GYP domain-containing protein [Lachnospiraceae bacterium]|nr:HD-GYP domain-containing protein [Lachnospiraceae bacterium]